MPTASSLSAKLELLSPGEECVILAATPASASESSPSLVDPEEEDGHSHSPASSSCSATYSNLGKTWLELAIGRHCELENTLGWWSLSPFLKSYMLIFSLLGEQFVFVFFMDPR